MKKHILTFFILVAFQIVNAKEANVFLKQVELEKIYTSKVTNFLDKMFDAEDYYVFADVQLVKKAESEENKSDDKNANKETTEAPSDPFGYTFIEGLGLDGGSLPTLPGANNRSKGVAKPKSNDDDYIMTGLKISVYLAENIYNVESRETITNFVNTNIQEIRNCFDCFILDKMPNKGGVRGSEELQEAHDSQAAAHLAISALRDSLKWSVFQQEQKSLRSELERIQKADSREIELLERQIDEASSAREFWEDQEARRKELQNNLDSLKFVSLIEIEKEYRAKTNELLDNMTADYEGTVQSRLDDAKATEARLFSLLENKSANTSTDDMEIESWSGSSGFGLLPTVVVVVIILIAVALLFLKFNKKKVVYLKPKKDPAPTQPQGYTVPPTESNENSDVVRSEIRSLRQSAVTMSAGQRDGASQIISDWLEESSSGDDADSENSEDKEE